MATTEHRIVFWRWRIKNPSTGWLVYSGEHIAGSCSSHSSKDTGALRVHRSILGPENGGCPQVNSNERRLPKETSCDFCTNKEVQPHQIQFLVYLVLMNTKGPTGVTAVSSSHCAVQGSRAWHNDFEGHPKRAKKILREKKTSVKYTLSLAPIRYIGLAKKFTWIFL